MENFASALGNGIVMFLVIFAELAFLALIVFMFIKLIRFLFGMSGLSAKFDCLHRRLEMIEKENKMIAKRMRELTDMKEKPQE